MPTNKVPAFNPIATGRAAALLLACATSACMTAPAGDARIWMGQVAEGRQTFSKPVKSWKDLKFTNLVRQQTDFSCGAAALATIFHYAYGRATTEQQERKSEVTGTKGSI